MHFIRLALAAAVIVVLAAPPLVAQEPDDTPAWSVRASTLYLGRSAPHASVILNEPPTGFTLNAREYGFDWQAGPDVSLFRQLAPDRALEVRYFNVAPMQARLNGVVPPFFQSLGYQFDSLYETQLYSTEVNLRQVSSAGEWLTWLAGFRWLRVSETLEVWSGFASSEDYRKHTTINDLYGGQLGADMLLWTGDGPFSLDGVVKAGLFGNAASNELNVIRPFGVPQSASDQRGQLAFVGEISLTGVYQWTEHVAVRMGYQLLWIEGVAVAGDQPAATNISTGDGIDSHSGILFHGAMTGLEFTW